jgi:hypothetical protein
MATDKNETVRKIRRVEGKPENIDIIENKNIYAIKDIYSQCQIKDC